MEMSNHSDSDESFHSADEDLDDESAEKQPEKSQTESAEHSSVEKDVRSKSEQLQKPPEPTEVTDGAEFSRPTKLWSEEDIDPESGEESDEAEKILADEVTPKVTELDESNGWDVEDWGDFEEDTMVTPGTGLPPANPSWAKCAEAEKRTGNGYRDSQVPSPSERLAGTEEQARPLNFWGGFNSLLSTVGEGLTNVIESVETTLGAPTPEDLARMSLEEREELEKKADEVKEPWPTEDKDDCDSAEEIMSEGGSDAGAGQSEEGSSGYQSDSARSREVDPGSQKGFTALFSGVTKTFETTSKTLVAGSLDVLESLGKKTFDVLTETDKETQRKRFILAKEKPNLSKVMRELKAKGEMDMRLKEEETEARRSNYAALFEEFQGMINLEALEMLSDNCGKQLDMTLKNTGKDLSEELSSVERAFEELNGPESFSEEDDHDFDTVLKEELSRLGLTFSADKLLEAQKKRKAWLQDCADQQALGVKKDGKEIYRISMECLAQLTACSVELFHKLGQLLLVSQSSPKYHAFVGLTKVLCQELEICCAKFSTCLTTATIDDSEMNVLLTNLFLEGNNSSGYIRDAFGLLKPVVALTMAKYLLGTKE